MGVFVKCQGAQGGAGAAGDPHRSLPLNPGFIPTYSLAFPNCLLAMQMIKKNPQIGQVPPKGCLNIERDMNSVRDWEQGY